MNRILLPLMILCLLIFGCEEEDPEAELITKITATFMEDFISPDFDPGILFYSDLDGNVLWAGSWEGNDTLEAVVAEGLPDRISMTTVVYDENFDRLLITSNMNVKTDSYTFFGGGADYRWNRDDSEVPLKIENDPGHSGYIVSSRLSSSSSISRSLYTGYSKSIRSSGDNLLVRIDPLNGDPLYTWETDVQLLDTLRIDVNSMMPLESMTINVPDVPYDRTFSIRGFNSDYYDGFYRFSSVYSFEIESNQTEIYYPPNLFNKYRTYMYVDEEPYPTLNSWYTTVLGDIPSSLEIMESDFIFDHTSQKDVEIIVAGDFTQISYAFEYEDEDMTYAWTVYTDLEAIDLPTLPPLVTSTYPDFDVDELGLNRAGIHNNDDLSYDAHVEQFFKSGIGIYNFISEMKVRYKDPAGLRPPE